jgi:Ca-activated chloride channel family protein
LSILGVGTADGAPIPRASGGFVTDNRGKIAVPRLEIAGLESLAAAGDGRFAQLTADNRDLDGLLSGEVRGSGRVASDDALATDHWREEGPWLLLLLLPLAALSFRRGWLLLVFIVILPMPKTAHASFWSDLWLNKDQRASKELQQGDPSVAAALFENPEWRAVARYRAGDFAGTARQLANSDDALNLYNLGNAMALQGELDAAIDAYTQVLERAPDDDDAQYNLDLVQNLKDQQQQQQQSEAGDQESAENSGGEGDESEGDPDEQSEGQSDSKSTSEEGETSERGEDEMSEEDMKALQEELQRAAEQAESGEQPEQLSAAELAQLRQQQEQQQAMEQWLRRVPDDPGGLLRNKFRYQYQRTGKDQDGNNVWPDNEVQPW